MSWCEGIFPHCNQLLKAVTVLLSLCRVLLALLALLAQVVRKARGVSTVKLDLLVYLAQQV